MAPTNMLATLYTTQADLEAFWSIDGVALRLNDSGNGTVSPTELAYLTTQGINHATSRINNFCLPRYSALDLQQSWTVNDWATIIASKWIANRRGNPSPESLNALYEETMEDLKQIKTGQMGLEDLQERISSAPKWANIRVTMHELRRVRVERPISEGTPPRVAPVYDLTADWLPYENW